LTTNLNLFPKSTNETLISRAEGELKTKRIESYFPPIPKGCTAQDGITSAMARLRRRALSKPIEFELLPEKFAMRQLQKLYEAILDTKLDKRNFINKFNSFDILIKLEEKDMSSSKKGTDLFKFDQEKYNRKVEDGFNFKI
jgi:hypothetical protein